MESKTPRLDELLSRGEMLTQPYLALARKLEAELAEAKDLCERSDDALLNKHKELIEARAEIERKNETIDADRIMLSARESLINGQTELIEQMRAEIERLNADYAIFSGKSKAVCIDYAEQIERKDKLIEQMRNCHNCGTDKKKKLCDRCLPWDTLSLPRLFNWSPKAALSAAERGE